MHYGYAGKILEVNLSKKDINIYPTPENLLIDFLGGRGLGAKLLYENLVPKIDPLSPENPLIFLTGPLNGTLFPSSNRLVITAKSPLTGIYGAAVAGGDFAPEMKFAGYDLILIKGSSQEPVYLCIEDNAVIIKPASHLWGKLIDETSKVIKEEMGQPFAKVAAIGPAGENLIPYACVLAEERAAARCGLGAVMGSKKLKAIAVRGRKSVKIKDPSSYIEICRNLYREVIDGPSMKRHLYFGTPSTAELVNRLGVFPTRNFQQGIFEGTEAIGATVLKDKYRIKDIACMDCPVACTKLNLVNEGIYKGYKSQGPEYETLYSFGSVVGNSNLDSIIAADKLCDQYGIDTMSCGISIAFVMECYQRGLLSRSDFSGEDFSWGNHEVIIKAIPKIARKEGWGAFVAQGVKKMAEELGGETKDFAIHVKGLELGGYDPRGFQGEGLSMATSERGGCHHFGGYIVAPETKGDIDPSATEGKAELVQRVRARTVLTDSANYCSFFNRCESFNLETISKALKAATGMDFTPATLKKIGERVITLERLLNVREGVDKSQDVLPDRLIHQPLEEGIFKGKTAKADTMLPDFYRINGWNPETGIPTAERLEELGLD